MSLRKGSVVKPPVFEYMAPATVEETVRALARHGARAAPLAGGQSLVPLLNRRRVRPDVVVDLGRVAGLDTVRVADGAVRIGALARLRTLERHETLGAALPVLRQTVRLVAHPQIRTRATLGGSLCHADPAAELPALAVALGARLRLAGAGGERELDAEEFFRPGRTARRPGELLTEITLPLRDGFTHRFVEIPRHAHGGLPLVGVCAGTRREADGTVTAARIAAAGAADRPLRLRGAERALTGGPLTEEAVARALDAAASAAAPPADPHGDAAYRTALLRTALRRALAAAPHPGTDPKERA
ncbi:molybdopterin dehydrogenase [Streptomyces sp. NHF165]|uniref:Carbon-monoxide dehydrogenase medium subunit n=1 Tax=Streptomyces cacaoi TaxID=1898 RepID=A0A4Y3QS08_STRCI|nr:molybdopterin dehydrogenase [Streptomyces sp. NHF165]GEB47719.1 carbon-monoxide dehydrogenase medium subunit [Streptomyces cacaoi]